MHVVKWTLALAMGIGASTTVSHACGNEVRLAKSAEVKALTQAERHLGKRAYNKAINTLTRTYQYGPMADNLTRVSTSKRLARRALRIAAIAAVRTRGTRSLRYWNRAETQRARISNNVSWAHLQLKQAYAWRPDDPQRKSQLAEAQALVGKRDAARTALESLAKDDLLIDAEAWALLADLRAEAGDSAGAKAARTRCSAVAPDAPFCQPTT
jgi:tetratricopeptide (TPR) repeat protein